jgi:hypothetical protein
MKGYGKMGRLERQHIGGAIERAAANLPDGFEIRIVVERGSAVVWLEDANGDDAVIDGSGLADSIELAIQVAKDSAE